MIPALVETLSMQHRWLNYYYLLHRQEILQSPSNDQNDRLRASAGTCIHSFIVFYSHNADSATMQLPAGYVYSVSEINGRKTKTTMALSSNLT